MNFRAVGGQRRPKNYCYMKNVHIYFKYDLSNIRTISRFTHVPTTNVSYGISTVKTLFKLYVFWIIRVLAVKGLHPYHFQRVQDLIEEYYASRIEFCRWILNNGKLLEFISWIDENRLTRNRCI